MSDWPFDQPRNCATVVSRAVLEGRAAITLVSHDADDHGWQFLDGETSEPTQVALVCLSTVVEMDSSVLELANLEPGWIATRGDHRFAWLRKPWDES